MRRTGDRADDDGVEVDAQALLLLRDLERPVREAKSAETVLARPCRDRIRLAAGLFDLTQGCLP
jgi:hypothetical protein